MFEEVRRIDVKVERDRTGTVRASDPPESGLLETARPLDPRALEP